MRSFKRHRFAFIFAALIIIIFSKHFGLEAPYANKNLISMNMDAVDTSKWSRSQLNSKSKSDLYVMNSLTKQLISATAQTPAELSTINNYSLSFERKADCNFQTPDSCYTTNKSLVITCWRHKSRERWLPLNMLSVFPEKYFDYIVMIHDNSTWNHLPGYDKIIWIHVKSQPRYWYIKRFISPHILRAYRYIWFLDDDIRFSFNTRVYECVADKFKILLSAPARGQGRIIYTIGRQISNYTSRIGRWTDYVEIGPIFVAQTLAAICMWNYLDEKLGEGYGLDLILCKRLSAQCFQQRSISKICAVLDTFLAHHDSTRVNSLRNGLAETHAYRKYFQNYSTKKIVLGPVAFDSSSLDDCEKQLLITS